MLDYFSSGGNLILDYHTGKGDGCLIWGITTSTPNIFHSWIQFVVVKNINQIYYFNCLCRFGYWKFWSIWTDFLCLTRFHFWVAWYSHSGHWNWLPSWTASLCSLRFVFCKVWNPHNSQLCLLSWSEDIFLTVWMTFDWIWSWHFSLYSLLAT